MLLTEYNEAETMEMFREEGREEGRKEELVTMVRNLLKAGTPIKYIQEASGWPEEKILELQP